MAYQSSAKKKKANEPKIINLTLNRAKAEELSKDIVKKKIKTALWYDWNETASNTAKSFIYNNGEYAAFTLF